MDTTTTSTRMKPRHSSTADSEQIMANIAETRAHMDGTLDELTDRLQPRHILDDVLDYFRSHRGSTRKGARRVKRAAGNAAGQVKEKAGDAGRVAYRGVKEHPLPALLIGAGVSLLLMNRNRDGDYEEWESEANAEELGAASSALPEHYQSDDSGPMDKIKEKSSELKEKASAGVQSMKERTAERTSAVRRRAAEQGTHLKEKARERYEQGREAFTRSAEERPLAMGLGFLAIGVVAGLLLPSTRKEDELVGPTRDRLVNRTREAAEDAVERGKHVAQTAVEAAKEEAGEQGLTPEALKQKSQAVASQVKEATQADAERQKEEFKQEMKQS